MATEKEIIDTLEILNEVSTDDAQFRKAVQLLINRKKKSEEQTAPEVCPSGLRYGIPG